MQPGHIFFGWSPRSGCGCSERRAGFLDRWPCLPSGVRSSGPQPLGETHIFSCVFISFLFFGGFPLRYLQVFFWFTSLLQWLFFLPGRVCGSACSAASRVKVLVPVVLGAWRPLSFGARPRVWGPGAQEPSPQRGSQALTSALCSFFCNFCPFPATFLFAMLFRFLFFNLAYCLHFIYVFQVCFCISWTVWLEM